MVFPGLGGKKDGYLFEFIVSVATGDAIHDGGRDMALLEIKQHALQSFSVACVDGGDAASCFIRRPVAGQALQRRQIGQRLRGCG